MSSIFVTIRENAPGNYIKSFHKQTLKDVYEYRNSYKCTVHVRINIHDIRLLAIFVKEKDGSLKDMNWFLLLQEPGKYIFTLGAGGEVSIMANPLKVHRNKLDIVSKHFDNSTALAISKYVPVEYSVTIYIPRDINTFIDTAKGRTGQRYETRERLQWLFQDGDSFGIGFDFDPKRETITHIMAYVDSDDMDEFTSGIAECRFEIDSMKYPITKELQECGRSSIPSEVEYNKNILIVPVPGEYLNGIKRNTVFVYGKTTRNFRGGNIYAVGLYGIFKP